MRIHYSLPEIPAFDTPEVTKEIPITPKSQRRTGVDKSLQDTGARSLKEDQPTTERQPIR